MAPTAHVIAYYVRTDGEVIADSLDVEIAGMLQNFVSNRDCELWAVADEAMSEMMPDTVPRSALVMLPGLSYDSCVL